MTRGFDSIFFLPCCCYLKSLCISRAVNHFYGTEFEVWTGFRPVGSTAPPEQLLATFECNFLIFFLVKITLLKMFKKILASELKSCIE